ncbi:UDP-N-acetylglucosamine 2-epimerase (non-hydrolyzing) [Ramlibacter sp. XY19]|uniref:non-hydrolyzing UDP-N-acetylglucosamine 2-epimerase n=1 Tax=Ramlibacter paludis TaxID=2908000 RepID=UPI0023DBEE61|nr:UDP-N-acetylglucosamine 2-epimerase (non-hydrolyzing) [Ramlibacter paludis]MCG2592769.1 UDP-N-acetylglucosamine 2-epimerase (non-hydrolyzing) [Ramlibacter paludis]
MDKKIVGIVSGTRPEIIKLAPVYHALRQHEELCVLWVHTGQHGEMAADMLRCFGITPDEQLARKGSSLEEFSVECRSQLDALMARQRWDMCIVQGDTESAFLGALAAFYRRVPVGHVEAGLRTYNLERPFPEEGLRQMISRITDLHWAPTERARLALLREGIAPEKIALTGNTVVDAQQWICEHNGIRREGDAAGGHILVTAHRRENWGDEMEQTFHAVADIARANPQRRILFPVHLNPVVQRPAHSILAGLDNVKLVAPLDYLGMQQALVNAALLLTDSGGLQEEAPTFGVPTLVLRHETERPEAVEAGCARLVGPRREAIVAAATEVLAGGPAAEAMRKVANPFGDGQASRRIAQAVMARLVVQEEAVAEAA